MEAAHDIQASGVLRRDNFHIDVDEMPTELIGKIVFELGDVDPINFPPGSFQNIFLKSDASATGVFDATTDAAKAVIAYWYERGNG